MPAVPVDEVARFELPRSRFRGGVYRLRDAERNLLYIGVGKNPASRIEVHATEKRWWPEVCLSASDVDWFRDYDLAAIAEKLAIRLERPRYNMIHSRSRPHWSHERGSTPRRSPFDDGHEVTSYNLRSQLPEVVRAVRVERKCLFLEGTFGPATPNAGLVPTELARLAQRLGGPDAAAQILLDRLRELDGDPTDL